MRACVIYAAALLMVACSTVRDRNPTADGGGSTDSGPAVDGGGDSGGTIDGGGCVPGRTLCGAVCVDTESDPINCGGCGVACAAGEACVGRRYEAAGCPGTQMDCGGMCVDTQSNDVHCGGCGFVCGPKQRCTMGMCV